MLRSFDIGSSWISTYLEINWDIEDQTVARLGYLNGDMLGDVFLVL